MDYPGEGIVELFGEEAESNDNAGAGRFIVDSPPLSSVCSEASEDKDADVDDLLLHLSQPSKPVDPLAKKFENLHLNKAALEFRYRDNTLDRRLARELAPCNCDKADLPHDVVLNKSRMQFSTQEPSDRTRQRQPQGLDDV